MAEITKKNDLHEMLAGFEARKLVEQKAAKDQRDEERRIAAEAGAVIMRVVGPVAQEIVMHLQSARHQAAVQRIEKQVQPELQIKFSPVEPGADGPKSVSATLTFRAEVSGKVTVAANVGGDAPMLYSMAAGSGTVAQSEVTEEWARMTILGFVRQVLSIR